MRHKGISKAETRSKVLAAASSGFREHGFQGIGVDGLAKRAGVTSGAFYAHCGSKNGAFELALEQGLDEVITNVPVFQKEHGAHWVREFVSYYLGKDHRGDLRCGCAMATLTLEVVRSGTGLHKLYEAKMAIIASLVADGLSGGAPTERRARAWAMIGILVGGINMARAMNSLKVGEEVASAITDAAIKAAGRARSVKPID
tara:strand:- start:135432 stop:136034 length:603 start_codon:yes stop_codon:yes gene_type:complete